MTVHGISADGKKLIGWASVPVPFATIAIALRFVSRHSSKSIGSDDWFMLLAVILYYGLYASIIIWVPVGGLGWPQSDFNSEQDDTFLTIFMATQILYVSVFTAIRISLLLLYRNIFCVIPYIPWTTFLVGLWTLVWCVSFTMTTVFTCVPMDANWLIARPRHCVDLPKVFWAIGISNLGLNIIVLCIPARAIWCLRLSCRRRLSLMVIFMLGILVCVVSSIGIACASHVDIANMSGTIALPSIWTSIEPGFAVVTGCLPTLLRLLRSRSQRYSASSVGLREVYPTGDRYQSDSINFRKKSLDVESCLTESEKSCWSDVEPSANSSCSSLESLSEKPYVSALADYATTSIRCPSPVYLGRGLNWDRGCVLLNDNE